MTTAPQGARHTELCLSNDTLEGTQCQTVRCPAHTIQFLRYDYTEYVSRALELAEVNLERLKLRDYERWTPYQAIESHDRLQRVEEDESGDSKGSSG